MRAAIGDREEPAFARNQEHLLGRLAHEFVRPGLEFRARHTAGGEHGVFLFESTTFLKS
jgi:hypothetical protein